MAKQKTRFVRALEMPNIPACTPQPDLSTVEKKNAFYNSDEYKNMTTAEKCRLQGDGFINDYD